MELTDTFRGITVCDLGQGVAAPHATMLLAQFGADVIKVEPAEGDWARQLGPPIGDHCIHSWVYSLGKRSVVLDLKSEKGRAALNALIARSDVFVESFRPGVAARLGLSYRDVSAKRPAMIYASMSGYGQEGPNSRRGTVDALVQAYSGMMAMNRTEDGTPRRQNMVAVDTLSGLYLFGLLATAIARQRQSGEGAYLDVSLMQCAAAFQAAKIAEFHLADGKPKPMYMPAGLLRTRDGAVCLATMREQHFAELAAALDRADWLADPRFVDKDSRIANGPALMAEIEAETREWSAAELVETLTGRGVMVERVNDYGEWAREPHVVTTDAHRWRELGGRSFPLANLPATAVPGPAVAAPAIGEHTDEVLRELGLRAAS